MPLRYWLNAGFLQTEQLLPVAQAAERLGFEGVALPDHLVQPERVDADYPYSADGSMSWPPDAPWPDCWVSIAAMASVTQRLRFTTCVYVAPLRDPFTVAKAVATAAGFGPARVSFGVGAGWMADEFAVIGPEFSTRGPRLDEMIEVLRALWLGDPFEHRGRHYSFAAVRMQPAVASVPILVGGNTAPALRRAAANDGWIGTYTDLGDVTRMIGELRERRERSGRNEHPFETLFAAMPGAARDASALDALGVDGLIIPAVALAGGATSTDDVIAGMERFAERRIGQQ